MNKAQNPKSEVKAFLSGMQAFDTKGQPMLVSDLWGSKPVILKVLRRLGCPFCRYEARMLSDLKPQFDALGISLVAITYEKTGIKEFLNSGYWAWDILVDQDKSIYKSMKLKKIKHHNLGREMMRKRFFVAFRAAIKAKIKFNTKGSNMQMGATIVVGPYGRNILYQFKQTKPTLFPSIKKIVSIVGGDPEEVDDELIGCVKDKYFDNMEIEE